MRPPRRLAAALVAATAAVAGGPAAPPAGAGAGNDTILVSAAPGGGFTGVGHNGRHPLSMTPDGRFVAFTSGARLVPEDRNNHADVYVRDVVAGRYRLASVARGGTAGNGPSSAPALSADGRRVAFVSGASNLVEGDENTVDDVFWRDLVAGRTVRVSVDRNGDDADGPSEAGSWFTWTRPVAISGNGRSVVFASWAKDLVPADRNERIDVFVRDVVAGTTAVVSTTPNGSPGGGGGYGVDVTPDGRHVAFTSLYALVAGDTNRRRDVYVRDLAAGTTVLASTTAAGDPVDQDASAPSVSDDGRRVVFRTAAALVPDDANTAVEAYLRDLGTGATVWLARRGGPAVETQATWISGDGTAALVLTSAGDLVPGEDDGRGVEPNLYRYDVAADVFVRVDVATDGTPSVGEVETAEIDATGRRVVFASEGGDIVAGERGGTIDVFLRDLGRA